MNVNNLEDIYALSPMQRGILFHTLYSPESGVYFNQAVWELAGALNVKAFKRAWQRVVARHSILRTAFFWEDLEQPLQVVRQTVELPISEHDWSELDPASRDAALSDLLDADRRRGFVLSEAPLMRLALIRLGVDLHQFVWSRHHLLLDGWAQAIMLRELFTLYEVCCYEDAHGEVVDEKRFLAPGVPYGRYIAWLQSQDTGQARLFWSEALKGFGAPTPLRQGWVAKSGGHRGGSLKFNRRLSQELTADLNDLASALGLTMNTILQGVWACLLAHSSGQRDIVFGVTVSGRPPALPQVESIVGLFINTLPLRVQVDPSAPFATWIADIQAQQMSLLQYEYTPLTDIHGWSQVPRDMPLFESVLVFENYPMEDFALNPNLSLQMAIKRSEIRNNLPLTIRAIPGAEMSLDVLYDGGSFDEAAVLQLAEQLELVLEHIAGEPGLTCAQLFELLQADDAQREARRSQQSKATGSQKLQIARRRSIKVSND